MVGAEGVSVKLQLESGEEAAAPIQRVLEDIKREIDLAKEPKADDNGVYSCGAFQGGLR
jgi:hypothetical protein